MTRLIVTSSTTMLGGRIGSSIPLFSPVSVSDSVFFNEGPRAPDVHVTSSLSGAMNTSDIDAYTQGVELTTEARYTAGIAKIWSGEPGHVLRRNRFGMDRNTFPNRAFADLDLFSPTTFIRAQNVASPLWSNILSFPIVIGNNDQMDNLNFDGVIEPLSIRRPASFTSIEGPQEAHSVRATYGSGNEDDRGGTELIRIVEIFNPAERLAPYSDDPFTENNIARLTPFSDARLVRNDVSTADERVMSSALSLMSGSTDGYIRYNQRSATCGFIYDNATVKGTDSLAFGGQIFPVIRPTTIGGLGTPVEVVPFPFTLLQRDYSGVPWRGSASTGTSILRRLVSAGGGSNPAVGAAVGGHTPANLAGGKFLSGGGLIWSSLVTRSAYTLMTIVFLNAASAPAANPYDDPAVFADDGIGNKAIGLGFNTSGANAFHISGGAWTSVQTACSTGAWHLVIVRYDGTNLSVQVDSAAAASIVKGNIDNVLSTTSVVFGAKWNEVSTLNGLVLEAGVSDVCFSNAQVTQYKAYVNARYGFTF
jgi:hypothetical protein